MRNEVLLSKTISFLRFPLIVGVVFIHTRIGEIDIQGDKICYNSWPWLNYIMDFFSFILPSISVPLFLFISGFLFFYKIDFNLSLYKIKLKTRYHSLIIPYLIWNFIGFLILLVQMHPRFSSIFPMLKDYRIDISEFLSYFWMRELPMDPPGSTTTPIDGPLWFLRDLILLVIATPIIHWLIKNLRSIFILVLAFIWFFSLGNKLGIPGESPHSVFFFPLGAYFSINKINFVSLANTAKWSPLFYLFFIVADIATIGEPINVFFHKGCIIVGIVAIIYIVSVLIENKKIEANKFLSDASFFVYALHGLLISKYMKAIVMIIHPESPFLVLFIYFFVPITIILICLGLYKGLYKLFPSVAKIVTGGR